MKILFIHQTFPAQFRHLAPALAQAGHSVMALGVREPAQALSGVQWVGHLPVPPAAQSMKAMPAALREFHSKMARAESAAAAMRELQHRGFSPDVVVAHPAWGEALHVKDVFPDTALLIYCEYFYGDPGEHSDFDPEFVHADPIAHRQTQRLKNTVLLHAMQAADAGLSPTQFQRLQHPLWFQERLAVIHDGIDTERFRPDPHASVQLPGCAEIRAGEEVLTFVARQLEPYRSYHTFMRALPALMRMRPQLRVVIVGGDKVTYCAPPPQGTNWKEVFLAEVRDSVDLQRIHFVGPLPHEVLRRLMQVSALHVYLSYPFVLSWSLLEAMSAGCLVLCSRTAALLEVIEEGRNGLLVDFFDPQALAQCAANALQERDQLRAVRERARITVQSRFDLHHMCLPSQLRLIKRLGQWNAP
jgi:glycosyltransferase involved in cell wall biosynthesis